MSSYGCENIILKKVDRMNPPSPIKSKVKEKQSYTLKTSDLDSRSSESGPDVQNESGSNFISGQIRNYSVRNKLLASGNIPKVISFILLYLFLFPMRVCIKSHLNWPSEKSFIQKCYHVFNPFLPR